MMLSCGGNDYLSVRDKAILSMLFETGIRCWELCCVKPDEIHDDYIVIVNGKNHKQRILSTRLNRPAGAIGVQSGRSLIKIMKKEEGRNQPARKSGGDCPAFVCL